MQFLEFFFSLQLETIYFYSDPAMSVLWRVKIMNCVYRYVLTSNINNFTFKILLKTFKGPWISGKAFYAWKYFNLYTKKMYAYLWTNLILILSYTYMHSKDIFFNLKVDVQKYSVAIIISWTKIWKKQNSATTTK